MAVTRSLRRHLTRRAIQRRLDRLKADGLGEYLREPWVLKRARGNYRRNIDQREWLQRREMRREARKAPGPEVPRWSKLRPKARTRKAKPFKVLCYWRWSVSGDPWRTSQFSYATLRGAEDAVKAFSAQRYYDRVEIVIPPSIIDDGTM